MSKKLLKPFNIPKGYALKEINILKSKGLLILEKKRPKK